MTLRRTHPFRGARRLGVAAVCAVAIASGVATAQSALDPRDRLSWTLYRELVTLPYYGVFDHLAFEVGSGGVVTLRGSVRLPSLKNDAESRAKSVEGVEEVRNEIEVLPASPQDDRIRLAAYRAIYRNDSLERYALSAMPPIHIVVNNGAVTLEGIVDSPMDSQLAEMQVRGVPGTFKITNNLVVDKP